MYLNVRIFRLKSIVASNAKIKQQLADAGFEVPLFTSDGSWLFEGGATEGALPTANGENNIENLKKVVNQYHNGRRPLYGSRILSGMAFSLGRTFSAGRCFGYCSSDREIS